METLYDADMELLRHEFITWELMDRLAGYTQRVNREISIFIARDGMVMDVSIGQHDRVDLRDLRVRRGRRRLSGIRCIHTHPGGSPLLSEVDVKTLERMRFDAMAAVGVAEGRPTGLQAAILSELHADGSYSHRLYGPYPAENVDHDMLFDEIEKGADVIGNAADIIESMAKDRERAALVGIDTDGKGERSLSELERLADTAGAEVVLAQLQQRQSPDAAYYIGRGKVSELALVRQAMDIDLFIFDDELSGAQIKNLEEELSCRVIDRTALILDIFAGRATTYEGKLQVELAQLKYRLPRLVGAGEALSRLAGGIGTRGPGESKLETDRRVIRRRLHELEEQVGHLSERRNVNRSLRKKNSLPVLAIVGYTNAGKSTLLNALTQSAVDAQDKLFATLDPVTRKLVMPDGRTVLVTDTVGFINKLPHDLVDAFRSTLEEAVHADILLHVVDVSSEDMLMQYRVAHDVLEQLGAGDKPVIVVLNKSDMLEGEIPDAIQAQHRVLVSAKNQTGFDRLLSLINELLTSEFEEFEIVIPYDRSAVVSLVYELGEVSECEYTEKGIEIKAHLSRQDANRISSQLR